MLFGYRVVVGYEYQPDAACEIQRKLASAIDFERMRTTGHEVGNDAGGVEISEAGTQLACTGVSQLLARNPFLMTQVAQFVVPEVDLHA